MIDLTGFGLASYGAWLVYAPAGFITAGVSLILVSFSVQRGWTEKQ